MFLICCSPNWRRQRQHLRAGIIAPRSRLPERRLPLAILRLVEAALKPSAKCLFTVLNGFAMARRHSNQDVAKNIFDPLGLTELSDVQPLAVGRTPATGASRNLGAIVKRSNSLNNELPFGYIPAISKSYPVLSPTHLNEAISHEQPDQ
jgi:hypothetical protein